MTDIATNTATPAEIENAGKALLELVAKATTAPPARVAGKAPKAKVACRCAAFTSEAGEYIECTATTGRLFAPGHDAKLKGLLLRAAEAGVGVWDAEIEQTLPAIMVAEKFGFGRMVAEGLAKRAAKAAARIAGNAGGPATQEDPQAGGPVSEEDPFASDVAAEEDAANRDAEADEIAAAAKAEQDTFDAMLAEVAAERAAEPTDDDGFPLADDETDPTEDDAE